MSTSVISILLTMKPLHSSPQPENISEHLEKIFHSRHHSEQVVSAVESRGEHDLLILGQHYNSRRTHTDSLWIFSPLVRSILGSLPSLQNNILILPDFSSEEIKTALTVLEGRKGEDLKFNSKTRDLLETLGVDLTSTQTQSQANKVKTREEESLGEILVENEIDELLYSSDDEETPRTSTEEFPNNEEEEEMDENDEDDENQLVMYQELSDSDEDSDDDENISYDRKETMETPTELSDTDNNEQSGEFSGK